MLSLTRTVVDSRPSSSPILSVRIVSNTKNRLYVTPESTFVETKKKSNHWSQGLTLARYRHPSLPAAIGERARKTEESTEDSGFSEGRAAWKS